MPFDGVDVSNRPVGLADAIARLGIRSVDPDVLLAHKEKQVALYPANFAQRHRLLILAMFSLMPVLLCAAAILAVSSLNGAPAIAAPLVCIVTTFALAIASERVVLRQQAIWTEKDLGLYAHYELSRFGLPREISKLLWQVRNEVGTNPFIRLIYGELTQGETVLDPYLIVVDHRTGARIILGIWEGDEVLHIAQ